MNKVTFNAALSLRDVSDRAAFFSKTALALIEPLKFGSAVLIRADPRKSRFVHSQDVLRAPAKDKRSIAGQHERDWLCLHADHGRHLTMMFGIVVREKKPQQIAQALTTIAVIHLFRRLCVKTHLPYQTPGALMHRPGGLWRARWMDQAHRRNGVILRPVEIVHTITWHQQRQVPVGDKQGAEQLWLQRATARSGRSCTVNEARAMSATNTHHR